MEWRLNNTYKPLENTSGWEICPVCKVHPRTWQFDNGRFADCKCGELYKSSGVSAIAVMTYYRKHGTLAGFPDNELRDNWNKLCEKRRRVIKISSVLSDL